MRILLVEPGYKNKYPPLGLMKISAYHKTKNDEVFFVKGTNDELKKQNWDRIYITTLFTFYWEKTINTIKYYRECVQEPEKIYLGGILATLLCEDLKNEPGLEDVTITPGLLDKPGVLGNDDIIVDTITPDYDIVDMQKNRYLDYEYEVQNAYITSTTKGCIRKCRFCAVKTLEPNYCGYIDIKAQLKTIEEKYGSKRNLMLMDNNVLASHHLNQIVKDLVDLGFGKGNISYTKVTGKRTTHQTRFIDFNQGTDARLLTEEIMQQLAKLEIKPLRIAFDHADAENISIYIGAQRLAAQYHVKTLSNYILFNFEDTPENLYKRLRININLNIEFAEQGLKTSIWSFPMKYMPINGNHAKDRKYIGVYWNAKLLRGVQCILNATHGVVGPKVKFFEHAFGASYEEFILLLYMPELLIIQRKVCEETGLIGRWKELYSYLSDEEKNKFIELIKDNKFSDIKIENIRIQKIYSIYRIKSVSEYLENKI